MKAHANLSVAVACFLLTLPLLFELVRVLLEVSW